MSVTGRIESVSKLGERWRAELLVGGARVVVIGQPGAGIPVTTLVEGRMASVTGIVRRPYPTAADQRYAILPRDRTDMRLLGAGAPAAPATAGGTRSSAGSAGSDAPPVPVGAVDADLIDLAAFVGRLVRVGGLVVDLRADGLVLDDGTTVGFVVLRGDALDLLPLLEPDDAINVIGRVEPSADGLAVVVDDPGGIIQAGDPVAARETGSDAAAVGSPAPATTADPAATTRRATLFDGPDIGGAGLAGLGTLVAVSLASLAVTFGRRAQARRRVAARIADRMAAFVGLAPGPAGPRSAERDSHTLDSA